MRDGFQALALARIYGTMLTILRKVMLTDIITLIILQQQLFIGVFIKMTNKGIIIMAILYIMFQSFRMERIKFYIGLIIIFPKMNKITIRFS